MLGIVHKKQHSVSKRLVRKQRATATATLRVRRACMRVLRDHIAIAVNVEGLEPDRRVLSVIVVVAVVVVVAPTRWC